MSLVSLSFFQTLLCIGHSYESFYRINSSTHTSFTQVDINYKDIMCTSGRIYGNLQNFHCKMAQGSPLALITESEQLHKYCVSSISILEMSCVLVFTFHCWTETHPPAWSANLVNWYLLTCAEVFISCPSPVPFLGYADMNILITIQLEM